VSGVGTGTGVLNGVHIPKGKGGLGGFLVHWFKQHFWVYWWQRNVFDSCVKSWQYFHTDNISSESLFHAVF